MPQLFIVRVGNAVFGLPEDSSVLASLPDLIREAIALEVSMKTDFYWKPVEKHSASIELQEVEDSQEELSEPVVSASPYDQQSSTAEELLHSLIGKPPSDFDDDIPF